MTFRAPTPSTPKCSEQAVREHLERVLASQSFEQADRLKRFLTFVVNETLSGRGDHLKEFLIGIEVFDKESSFDPRTDPIVRVQARRLRSRLEKYYAEEGRRDPVQIELLKGGYAPIFKHTDIAAPKRALSAAFVSRNTVAVIPFADHSQDGDQGYFCNGISDEIIHALLKLGHVRVVAWDRSRIDKPGVLESTEPSDAALVITGGIRRFGARSRVTVHIIDAASGCFLWTESLDRSSDDLLPVQEEIAARVAETVKSELLDTEGTSSQKRRTENLAAYNLYLQGRYHLSQRTEEGLHKAAEFFDRAIREDAQYCLAYAGLADAYGLLGHYGALAPAEVWTKAASNAATAVLVDDKSAEAHASLAHVKSTQDWDWIAAEREFRRAIQLDPRYPTAHHWYGISCLAPLGKLDEALEQLLLAQALDPVSPIIARDVAVIHYYRRDFEAALEQCDHTVELNPHFSPAYWTLGIIQELRKDFEESAAAFQRAIQLSPHSPRMRAALARTLALSGKRTEAQNTLWELNELEKKRYVSPFEFASIHFALDQYELGFEWLWKAVQDRCFELISIKVDPRFDALRA
ncbi:MAG: tetratricopeptide repeat protein, partial [Acidobacteriaceae bacterium]|nr:tetratricopeptide repeat protein [Acidobacteriaceae bacterium]